jgi:hypothetical protein
MSSARHHRRRLLFGLLTLLGASLAGPAQAQAVPEYVMKATYLYNFMVFAEWPPVDARVASDPVTLCVFGQDNFGTALDSLEGKNVNGRRLTVLRMNSLAQLRKCHLLFITEREAVNMASIQNSLGDAPVLTVADTPQAGGAAIVLALDGKRLVFDINLQRIKRSGITLSSKVLQLARSAS